MQNKPIIGWLCIHTPEEIIDAAGFLPYRITSPIQTMGMSRYCFHGNLSYHVMNSFDASLQGKYDFLSGVVIANSDDAMRRAYDAWKHYLKIPFVYLLDIPKVFTNDSIKYFSVCLHKLIKAIEDYFKIKITEDNLNKSIDLYNEMRWLLKKLQYLRRENNPSIGAFQFSELIKLTQRSSKKEINEEIKSILSNLGNNIKSNIQNTKPRIMLSGGYLDQSELVKVIDELGGNVVCEDTCTGVRYFEDIVESEENPMDALSKRYLGIPSARMLDMEKRFNYILRLVEGYRIDGIIYFTPKFYDPNLFEFPYLRKKLNEEGIRVLYLEGESSMCTGQIRTRIQAFLEMF